VTGVQTCALPISERQAAVIPMIMAVIKRKREIF
jgi:hypothetical protein